MKKKSILLFLLMFIVFGLIGCAENEDENKDNNQNKVETVDYEATYLILQKGNFYEGNFDQFKEDMKAETVYDLLVDGGYTKTKKEFFVEFLNISNDEYDNAYEIYLSKVTKEISYEEWVKLTMDLLFAHEISNTISFMSGDKVLETEENFFSLIEIPNNPVLEDFEFKGWFFQGQLWNFEERVPEDDLELEAVWFTNVEFNITYNLNGGNNAGGNPDSYNQADAISLANPTKQDYVFKGWYFNEDLTGARLENVFIYNKDLEVYAAWEIESFNLPIFCIDLDMPLSGVEHGIYSDAKFSLLNVSEDHVLKDISGEIKGRGHGSWTFPKKGYKIKFSKKQPLFGLESNKHWVIVPGGHDNSLMKANIAFSIVNENLTAIEYTTAVNIVEVYVNGKYYGIYSLFEHVRVATGRVDIKSKFGVEDTGYLIEYDSYIESEGVEGIDYFWVPGLRYPFAIKSPDPEDYLDETTPELYFAQVEFIKNYMIDVVDAIFSKDFERFSELVDVDSFVDMYIIHELFKNTDTGWSSFYMYKKPGGKLYAGPAWDFDLSAGSSRGESGYTGIYVGDTARYKSDFTSSEMYISLMKQSGFVNKVKARYLEVYEGIIVTIDSIYDDLETYQESFKRDSREWTKGSNLYYSSQADLYSWLMNRIAWLKTWAQ